MGRAHTLCTAPHGYGKQKNCNARRILLRCFSSMPSGGHGGCAAFVVQNSIAKTTNDGLGVADDRPAW